MLEEGAAEGLEEGDVTSGGDTTPPVGTDWAVGSPEDPDVAIVGLFVGCCVNLVESGVGRLKRG